MEPNTIDRGALSPELQERLQRFDSTVSEYQELQEQFTTTRKETQRLLTTAAALDAEAEQANQSWKEAAKAKTADQRKINAEIERGAQSKAEADKHRRTAEVREELHGEIALNLAEARLRLKTEVGPLNRTYRQERLETLLATDGLSELLAELYALNQAERHAEMDRMGVPAEARTRDDIEDLVASDQNAFGRYLVRQFQAATTASRAVTVVAMPKPVSGEIIAKAPAALNILRKNGGQIPDSMARCGGAPTLVRA
jgi:chromosome segregation ATPase